MRTGLEMPPMKLKLIALAAATLFASGAAQAQEQQWYLTGSAANGTALVLVDLSSVRLQGDQATGSALMIKLSDDEPPATLATIRYDCTRHQFSILTGQVLDIDAKPIGDVVQGDGTLITVAPGSFFEGTQDFLCGGSAHPDPQLLIGNRMPVRAAHETLRSRKEKAEGN